MLNGNVLGGGNRRIVALPGASLMVNLARETMCQSIRFVKMPADQCLAITASPVVELRRSFESKTSTCPWRTMGEARGA
ncbi:hypothetical protein [Mycobacterium sp.]|uniref:hypothetical protein n=1 Tax=Mycobacterium sp. TaxID=1785 RepID=UPI003F9B6512